MKKAKVGLAAQRTASPPSSAGKVPKIPVTGAKVHGKPSPKPRATRKEPNR